MVEAVPGDVVITIDVVVQPHGELGDIDREIDADLLETLLPDASELLGLGPASQGCVEATRMRAEATGDARPLFVQLRDEAAVYFVIAGYLTVSFAAPGDGEEQTEAIDLTVGDAVTVAPGVRHGLSLAEGTVEFVRVTARLR